MNSGFFNPRNKNTSFCLIEFRAGVGPDGVGISVTSAKVKSSKSIFGFGNDTSFL